MKKHETIIYWIIWNLYIILILLNYLLQVVATHKKMYCCFLYNLTKNDWQKNSFCFETNRISGSEIWFRSVWQETGISFSVFYWIKPNPNALKIFRLLLWKTKTKYIYRWLTNRKIEKRSYVICLNWNEMEFYLHVSYLSNIFQPKITPKLF